MSPSTPPFEELAAFAAVVEAGGFTTAAKRLGVAKSTVSDQVRRLEDRLGAQLLTRTTRRVSLTEAGQACYRRCARMSEEAEGALRDAQALQDEPLGRLRIAAPQSFGPMHVTPAVASFCARHPMLEPEMLVSAAWADLVGDRIDLAIRIGTLPDSSLVARRLTTMSLVVAGAPAYLDQRGRPSAPEDLSGHDALVFSPLGWGEEWRLRGPDGARRTVPVVQRFVTDSGEALLEAACAGLGLALLPDWLAWKRVKSGELARTLPGWGVPDVPIHALHQSPGHPPAKVRLFVDHLRRHFGAPPYWA